VRVFATDIHWVDVDHPRVLRMALDAGFTTYDAMYLYLLLALDALLVTFDERLQSAARIIDS